MGRDETQFGRKGQAGLLFEQFDTLNIVTISGTTGQLPDTEGLRFLLIAHPDNVGPLYLGDDGVTYGFPMEAGLKLTLEIENLNQVYVEMGANDQLNILILDETTLDAN